MKVIILFFLLIQVFHSKEFYHCSPEKCYRSLEHAIHTFEVHRFHAPKFSVNVVHPIFNRINNLIERFTHLTSLLERVQLLQKELEQSKNSSQKLLDLIDKFKDIITKLIRAANELQSYIKGFKDYQLSCSNAKTDFYQLQKEVTSIKIQEKSLDNYIASMKDHYSNLVSDISQESEKIQEDIDVILKNTPLGGLYFCKRFEKNINDLTNIIRGNKDALSKLLEDLFQIVSLKKFNDFLENTDDLKKYDASIPPVEYTGDANINNEVDGIILKINVLFKRLPALKDSIKNIEEAEMKELEKLKYAIEEKLKNWEDFLKELLERKNAVIEEIQRLKNLENLNTQREVLAGKLNMIAIIDKDLYNVSCPISHTPEPRKNA